MQDLQTNEPAPHVENVKSALDDLIEHVRRDATIIDEPRASALFEMSAEVLEGLRHAFERYAKTA